MTMIFMILTVYVTEEGVWVCEISNFSATKFWTHRQDTEHVFLYDYTVSAIPYKRFVNNSVQAVTTTGTSHSDQLHYIIRVFKAGCC
jgi:hypothetical protein